MREAAVQVQNVDNLDFNIFELEKIYGQVRTLDVLGTCIFSK